MNTGEAEQRNLYIWRRNLLIEGIVEILDLIISHQEADYISRLVSQILELDAEEIERRKAYYKEVRAKYEASIEA